ncbi:hypothetical protein TYRP_019692 [Tyrophagus putrescentiae]|nr:hypothetical protein TYRP_019692 [Tyrophagus putrescentiae]
MSATLLMTSPKKQFPEEQTYLKPSSSDSSPMRSMTKPSNRSLPYLVSDVSLSMQYGSLSPVGVPVADLKVQGKEDNVPIIRFQAFRCNADNIKNEVISFSLLIKANNSSDTLKSDLSHDYFIIRAQEEKPVIVIIGNTQKLSSYLIVRKPIQKFDDMIVNQSSCIETMQVVRM